MPGALLRGSGAQPFIIGGEGRLIQGMGYYTMTASGTVTLDNSYPNVVKIDPGGAHRDVTLDDEATHEGLFRLIINAADAAENLVCKDSGGDTIATINQNEAALLYCDGTAATGWSLAFVFTIALS